MNNFPAMTEAQRQELIKRLIRFRKGIQAARDANMQTEADDNDDLIAQIALASLTADGWIKCSERMPEIGSSVLVVLCGKHVQSAYYRQWKGAKTEKGRAPRFEDQRGLVYGATHWMPLPSPPEASNEQ